MYHSVGCNLLIIAYRGYSSSAGVPTEAGIKQDGHAMLNYIISREDVIDKTNIFVMGRSLGGAVAVSTLASGDYKVKGVILENTFTSIDEMVDKIFPYVSIFKKLILRNHWHTADLIKNIDSHFMFIIAAQDELVPPAMSETLIEKATWAKSKYRVVGCLTQYEIKDAGHNGSYTVDPKNYFTQITNFINSCK